MASEGLHEPADLLSAETIDLHRGYTSVIEELEAIDWYNQRVEATNDDSLAAVLAHNRDEEKEHFAMTLEWLRRHDAKIDQMLRQYLFAEGDVLAVEEAVEHGGGGLDAGGAPGNPTGNLGIGSLRNESEGEL